MLKCDRLPWAIGASGDSNLILARLDQEPWRKIFSEPSVQEVADIQQLSATDAAKIQSQSSKLTGTASGTANVLTSVLSQQF